MRTGMAWLCRWVILAAWGLGFAGASLAQTTVVVDERKFEVISVDGNMLVVRDQNGTHEYAVPTDFRLTVDGKSMAVSDLKPGMKGSATITTTTTVKPVVITEVREGEVLRASELSVTVRDANGTRRFTQGDLDARGVRIVKDGQPVRVAQLQRGDKLTATFITSAAPVVLTDKEVQATLDEAKALPPTQVAAAPAAAQGAAPAAAQGTAPAAYGQPATATPPAAAPVASPKPAADAAPKASESSGTLTWYVIIAALIAVALFAFLRRRKSP